MNKLNHFYFYSTNRFVQLKSFKMSAWNWKNLFRGNVAPTQPQTPVIDTSKPLLQSTSQILPTQTTSSSQTKSIHEFHLKILIVGSPGAGK
jgi:hypothetical protein